VSKPLAEVFCATGARFNIVTFSQYSVWLQTARPGFDSRQRQRMFLLASVSRPALRPTHLPVQWVSGVPSPGLKRGWGVTLTSHSRFVPRSGMSRSYVSSPPSPPSWRVVGQL
jgi:hypothetical protein